MREKLLLEMKRELKKMQASGTFGAAVHGQQLTTHDLPTSSATSAPFLSTAEVQGSGAGVADVA